MADSESESSAKDDAIKAADLSPEIAPAAASRKPYGPPINDAIAGGDLQYMKAVAEGARRALYGIDFAPVTVDQYDEVQEALAALEAAILRLEPGGRTAG